MLWLTTTKAVTIVFQAISLYSFNTYTLPMCLITLTVLILRIYKKNTVKSQGIYFNLIICDTP